MERRKGGERRNIRTQGGERVRSGGVRMKAKRMRGGKGRAGVVKIVRRMEAALWEEREWRRRGAMRRKRDQKRKGNKRMAQKKREERRSGEGDLTARGRVGGFQSAIMNGKDGAGRRHFGVREVDGGRK